MECIYDLRQCMCWLIVPRTCGYGPFGSFWLDRALGWRRGFEIELEQICMILFFAFL
ncbi:hypothetical protein HETIRDRAFT_417486 [Heterobasidion irregulare TC 32-1]|uniref:Uncharacterized protein n=1 Tax=Heterobasidion irregulare (strain TC 32-1) TaxID=747525 RepID=W4K8F5_HETIT|nr:uncharacterized protein HETIRDRAFT_417486 [Heterobasidion irregulare TC 32-1]ETW81331.1 hypothetical protein HETIRDRAFT_417486 [Heterobasidion irregulare TC 32-1]